jgi:hypothetical protein
MALTVFVVVFVAAFFAAISCGLVSPLQDVSGRV